MIQAGQIYFLRKVAVNIGQANYPRPCLVLRVSNTDVTICYFSTKLGLRRPDEVLIEKSDPDFVATGLNDSSYILNNPVDDVKFDFLKNAKFLGHATGDFKRRIEKWYGAPLK